MHLVITGADQLKSTAAALRKAGREDLRKELSQGVRSAAKPILADVRKSVLSIDSNAYGGGGGAAARHAHAGGRSGKRHGLRASIARATSIKVQLAGRTVGLRIRMDAGKLPADQRKLPKNLDRAAGWRHPVYGNRNAWVRQTGRPWFYQVIEKHAPRVRRELVEAMNRIVHKIG